MVAPTVSIVSIVSCVRVTVALVVTTVWAAGCTVAFIVDTRLIGLATVITPVMLAVVGWLFTQEIIDRQRDKHGDSQ